MLLILYCISGLSIQEYLHKMSKSMHIKVILIETTSGNEGFLFSNYVLLRNLLAENMF